MITERVEGVLIGLLLGFDGGVPLVVYPGNSKEHAVPARTIARLGPADIGCQVALLYEDGDSARPLVIGKVLNPSDADAPTPPTDAKVVVTAADRIELRVGKAAIIMDKDGRITIRGTNLVSHGSAGNRIRGGSISLN